MVPVRKVERSARRPRLRSGCSSRRS